MGGATSSNSRPVPWREMTVEQVATALEGLGKAYCRFAEFARENGVDGAMIVECGGVEEISQMIEPPPSKLHQRKFSLAISANEKLVAASDKKAAASAEKAAAPPKSTAAPTHNTAENIDTQIPESVREFVPIQKVVSTLANAPAFLEAQRSLQSHPTDEGVAAILEEHISRLSAAVHKEAVSRLNEPGIARSLKQVQQDGNKDFLAVYQSVWSMIKSNDRKGLVRYVQATKAAKFNSASCDQNVSSIVELLRHGASCKPHFNDFVTQTAATVHGVELTIPTTLKRASRIVEKVQLDPKTPGSPRRVFDVVRGMIVCQSLGSIASVVAAFTQSAEISLVRAKERFLSRPSGGGWRDYMLCFYLDKDPNRHICELQIVHKSLLMARKGLPGHAVYNIVRNATELLEMMTSFRERFGWTLENANRAEMGLRDKIAAGFVDPSSVSEADFQQELSPTERAKQKFAQLRKLPGGPEANALIEFSQATGREKWKTPCNWKLDVPLARWRGVTANGPAMNVRMIKLHNKSLHGRLPGACLAALQHLTHLDLNSNTLSGPLPSEIGQLTQLRVLNLRKNNFAGILPNELMMLKNLESLIMSCNNFEGILAPALFMAWDKLKILDLEKNVLNGAIPSEIGLCRSLVQLNLRTNLLAGPLPRELGNLSNATRLDFAGNTGITGYIPTEIAKLSKLQRAHFGMKKTWFKNARETAQLRAELSTYTY